MPREGAAAEKVLTRNAQRYPSRVPFEKRASRTIAVTAPRAVKKAGFAPLQATESRRQKKETTGRQRSVVS